MFCEITVQASLHELYERVGSLKETEPGKVCYIFFPLKQWIYYYVKPYGALF